MNRDDGIDDIIETKSPIGGMGDAPHWAAFPDLREGATLFGRYICGRKLGGGGMGHVYLVRDLVTQLLFALKLIIPRHDCPEARHRFRREITIQRRFLHPNIVTVHDFGMPTPNQHGFIVMKYIDGPNLENVIGTQGKMTLDTLAALVEQGSTALEVVHGAGIIHRDVKPSNIFMTTRPDGRPIFKLGDFGVAKDLVDPDFSFRTKSNALVGTPLYLAPEVLYGGEPTLRADLFAFGVVVARAATGMTTREVICWANRPIPPSLPELPAEASIVLARVLSLTPSGRPETAGEFAREFLRSLRSPSARPQRPRRSWAAGLWPIF